MVNRHAKWVTLCTKMNNQPVPTSPTKGIIESHLRWAIALLILVIAFGVAGYMVIERWSFLDALFMTVTTLSTVGYREVHELSTWGQVFTIFLIVFGVGGMLYTATAVVTYVVEVQFPGIVRRRRMAERIAELRNHFIVCGFGRVGQFVAQELWREHAQFVVVEGNPEVHARCENMGYVCLLGDATADETLKTAGIERARGLVAALDTDEKNLYVVLSARVLRPDIFIVSRSTSEDAEAKLKRVGANRVLSPYVTAGRRMATLLMRPLVADFLDTVMHSEQMELLLEEMTIPPGSPMANTTIGQLHVKTRTGAFILAIQRSDGSMITAPHGDTVLREGDRLVVLGTRAQLRQLEQLEMKR